MVHFGSIEKAIDAMADGRNIEIVTDYSGAEAGIHHGRDCVHHGRRNGEDKEFTAECVVNKPGEWGGDPCAKRTPLFMETKHEGLVVGECERSSSGDSDYYAVIWNDEKAEPYEVLYASTRGWTYPNSAIVDATGEVREKYDKYIEKMNAISNVNNIKREISAFVEDVKIPSKGKVCKVVRGRKVPVGTTGLLFWTGGDYGKCGLALDDKRDSKGRYANIAWTYIKNVEVEDWETDSVRKRLASYNDSLEYWEQKLSKLGE